MQCYHAYMVGTEKISELRYVAQRTREQAIGSGVGRHCWIPMGESCSLRVLSPVTESAVNALNLSHSFLRFAQNANIRVIRGKQVVGPFTCNQLLPA
jgi:hypothetical protein